MSQNPVDTIILYTYKRGYIVCSNSIDIKIEELYYTQNVQGINLYDISM